MEHSLIVNGVELEFSVFNADFIKKFQQGLSKIKGNLRQCARPEEAGESVAQSCKLIFGFFEELFGSQKAKEIFGDDYDLMIYVRCLDKFITYVEEQMDFFEQLTGRYSPVPDA
ncbi:MAG: hypothetical protein IKS19_03255 [Clostridia bacterium]|nr:hypothetical protein [Clostridia bacterium]